MCDSLKYHFVYMVQCSDGTLYTGYATDVAKRVKVHNAGRGSKYVKTRLPCVLVWESLPYADKSNAMRTEWHMKRWSREEKVALIQNRPFPTGPVNHSFKFKP